MPDAWLVRCGDGGRHLEAAIAASVITLGYREAGDVTQTNPADVAFRLRGVRDKSSPERIADMLYAFAQRMQPGDVVFSSDAARQQAAVGEITGAYRWSPQADIPGQHHVRSVDWWAALDWSSLAGSLHDAVAHYEGAVLWLPDQRGALEVAERARREATGPIVLGPKIRATRTARDTSTRRRSSRAPGGDRPARGATRPSTAPAARPPERAEKVCTNCFLRKPVTAFPDGGDTCLDCVA
ncbi:MAG TPA: hypothetical protein VFP54_07365 [Acidimicrobiales bacterium]|nr:hypothetical protein [Acidimicrobiales bacterium]